MYIGSEQCLFIIVIITALIGLRGWHREVVTMAIILGMVLFLSLGGDGLLHQFFFVNLPDAFRVLIFGDNAVNAGTPTVSSPNGWGDQLFRLGAFGGLTGLAYLVGHKYGSAPKTTSHKVIGMVPGAVNGVALSYYVTNGLFPNNNPAVTITSPTNALTTMYLPIILGLALLGLVLIIVVSSFSKPKGGSSH
jgi:hypothetical protein